MVRSTASRERGDKIPTHHDISLASDRKWHSPLALMFYCTSDCQPLTENQFTTKVCKSGFSVRLVRTSKVHSSQKQRLLPSDRTSLDIVSQLHTKFLAMNSGQAKFTKLEASVKDQKEDVSSALKQAKSAVAKADVATGKSDSAKASIEALTKRIQALEKK